MRRNILCSILVLVLSVGALMAAPARAQIDDAGSSEDWHFGAAVYLWGAGIGGKTGRGSEIEVSFGDLVDNLEMGFMGSFEARKGKWMVLTDILYLDIGVNKFIDVTVPIGPGSIDVTTNASLDLTGLVLHFAGGYNLWADDKSRLDLVAGARYLDLETTLFLSLEALGPGRERTLAESGSVWDGIVGVKGNIGLGERWYLPYYVDIGAGESDFTWQAMGGVSFRAASWADLVLVYRHLEWDIGSDTLIADINFSGPTFGAIFRF